MGINQYVMKRKILYIIYLLVFMSCPVLGQVDDPVEKLTNGNVNDSGTAVTYSVTSQGKTYLNVYHTKNNTLMQFSGIHADMILTDDVWLGWNFMERTLYRVDLKTWKKEVILGADHYHWFADTGKVLVFDKVKKTIELYDDRFKNICSVQDVHSYELSATNNRILILLEEGGGVLLSLDGKKLKEVSLKLGLAVEEVKKIKWNPFNLKFYLFKTDTSNLEILSVTNNEVNKLMVTPLKDTEHSVIDTTFRNLEFIDKDRILIGVKPVVDMVSDGVSQVWLGSSNGFTPQIRKMYENNLQAAVINLGTGTKTSLFEKGKLNSFKIHPNSGTVYGYEKNGLEDFTRQFPAIRVYEHETNKPEKKFLGEFKGRSQYFLTSELSCDLFYFKDNGWYSYNGKTKVHNHITKDMEHHFYDDRNEYYDGSDFLPNQQIPAYKDKWLIFESTTDVWLYDPETSSFAQKTDGTYKNRKYSVARSSKHTTYNNLHWSGNTKIKNKQVLLNWHSDDFQSSGLSLLKDNGKVQDLVEVTGQLSQAVQSERFVTYVKERADIPPALYMLDKKTGKERQLYQTNKNDTIIAKTEYFTWRNELGQQRGVVVRYPKNYDSRQRYPAIVDIYEKKYTGIHKYAHVSELVTSGINYRRYTEDGYFVIEPDIYYQLGKTGSSALKCVNEALDQVLSKTSVDSTLIGIVGHSFGGYETNFIITQTERFKAAVSSAGVFDLESYYLTIDLESMRPDMWRMESQQWRMGKGMYDDRELYRSNSPSLFAKNITTPLLLVMGAKDYVINYRQSVMMFLAMKRLGKEVNLLLYPKEGHSIMDPVSRRDYNIKIKEWFDFKLKSADQPDWLKEGLQ